MILSHLTWVLQIIGITIVALVLYFSVKRWMHFDRTTVTIIARLLRIFVGVVSVLVILQALGYPISGLLAIGGAGTIIAGLAAKDLLANFFGGLMIYLDRPFLEGDWVRSPDRDIEGKVAHIGWRLTRIMTFERRPIYIPNSIFATIIVENASRMSHRRIQESFGFSYDNLAKIPVILTDIRHLLENHPHLAHNEESFVHVVHFGDNAVECKLQTFTIDTTLIKYLKIQEDIFLKIMHIIQHHDATLSASSMAVRLNLLPRIDK